MKKLEKAFLLQELSAGRLQEGESLEFKESWQQRIVGGVFFQQTLLID